jgi:hypothetical protein
MRFAGLFKDIIKAMKPAGPLDAAMRYGPDAVSLLASGTAWAPPDATLGERAGLMLEDGVLGLGLSSVMGGGARHLGRRHLLGNRKPGMGLDEYNNKLVQLQQFGDLANMPIQMFTPRPFAQHVYNQRAADAGSQQQGLPEPGMTEEEMAMALLATGALGGSVLGPRDSFAGVHDPFDLRGYTGLS